MRRARRHGDAGRMNTTTRTLGTTSPLDAQASSAQPATASSLSRIRLTRAAGVAALVKALTYIAGFAVMGAYLAPRGFADAQGDPAASLDLLLAEQGVMYAWYLALYIVGGLALIVLVQGLQATLARVSPVLSQTSGILGQVWAGLLLASGLVALVGQTTVIALAETDRALAVSTWSSVTVIQDALGGGIEIVGAAWILIIGWIGLRSRTFGLSFSLNAVLIGLLGTATLIPATADLAATSFGLTFVVWFVWAAIVLLRRREPVA